MKGQCSFANRWCTPELFQGIPEIEVQEESSEPGIQTAQTANRGGLAGVSFATSGLRGSLSGGLGKMEPEHRRRGSQESIVSEISSVPGSDLSRAVSMDVPLESSLWGFAGMEPSGEGGSSTGTEVESLKGVGLILPVDQRSRVRRVMMILQRRLVVVKTDMDDLLARLNQETAVKDFLTTKVILLLMLFILVALVISNFVSKHFKYSAGRLSLISIKTG